jgi:hypothetical protein
MKKTSFYRFLYGLAATRSCRRRARVLVRRGHHGHEPDCPRSLQRGKQIRGKLIIHEPNQKSWG